MNPTDLEPVLLAWCNSRICPPEPITPDCDLIDSGLLDSLVLVDLLSMLESRFALVMANSDVSPRNFRSVATIAALCAGRLGAGTNRS